MRLASSTISLFSDRLTSDMYIFSHCRQIQHCESLVSVPTKRGEMQLLSWVAAGAFRAGQGATAAFPPHVRLPGEPGPVAAGCGPHGPEPDGAPNRAGAQQLVAGPLSGSRHRRVPAGRARCGLAAAHAHC